MMRTLLVCVVTSHHAIKERIVRIHFLFSYTNSHKGIFLNFRELDKTIARKKLELGENIFMCR